MSKLKSSFIITVYNEGGNISAFLDSYVKQTVHSDELIILDGGSTDATADIVKRFAAQHPDLHVRFTVNTDCQRSRHPAPIARGRNAAIALAIHDIIIVSDGGCVLSPAYVEEMLRTFERDDPDVVSGWYRSLQDDGFHRIFSTVSMPTEEDALKEGFLPSSRSLALKKRCWEKVGGYPEKTFTGEDTLFDLNLKKAGCRFKTNLKALVYWETPGSLREAMSKQFSYGKGDGALGTFKLKYLARWITLLLPFRILLNKRKRAHTHIVLLLQLAYQLGYTRGLFGSG